MLALAPHSPVWWRRAKSQQFYSFKLHLIINDRGEILNFMITPGNTDDHELLRNERYVQDINGKFCDDWRYIGENFF